MSITSSDNQGRNPDLVDLLVRYASLAGWLSNALYSAEEPQAEILLPRFLAECADQGIPESAYPFTAADRGLQDLRIYLQSARAEIDAFHFPMPSHRSAGQADAHRFTENGQPPEGPTASIDDQPEETPTDKIPVLKAASAHKQAETEQTQSEQMCAPEEVRGEAVAALTQIDTVETTDAETEQREDTGVHDATPESDTTDANDAQREGEDVSVAGEDIAQLATVRVPSVAPTPERAEHLGVEPVQPENAGANAEKGAEYPGADLAQPANTSAGAEKGAEHPGADLVQPVNTGAGAEIGAAQRDPEETTAAIEAAADVAQQTTLPMPVLASVPDHIEGKEQPPTAPSTAPERHKIATPRRKGKRGRRPRTRGQRILTWVLVLSILATVLVPAGFLLNFGINAYNTYHDLSNQAHSAVNHLLNVKTDLDSGSTSTSHLSAILNTTRLQRAEQDFIASGHDFQQLQKQLKYSSTLQTVVTYFPQYRETLTSAQAASQIGLDVAAIGQIATSHATQIAPSFSGSLLAATGKPLVTQSLLNTLNATIDQAMPLLKDIQVQSQYVSLDALPISASEKTQVGQLFQLLPQAITDLGVARSMLGDAGWLLGVDQPRTFLVQTMDRAELRGAGGFTGQYGELTINGGRIAPFSLKDISLVEYTNNSVTQGQLAPEQYRSWWPFANWGLRDSNISADFPTTAQLAIDLYKQETGHQVDGVISFTPVVIEHVLAIIGPIQVPDYNITVTAQNLEDVLHYYQLNNTGILQQIINQPNNTSTSQRKRFTNYLTTLLMAKVRSAPVNQLLAIADQMLSDLKSKDLQMYFSDPGAEGVLVKYGYAGLLDRSTTHDGLYVVQQNLSASKASQYVQTTMQDTVTLNKQGGATHTLQIRLVYNQAGPVYGYDTYYDYLRVYVPPSSQLLSGDGFSSGIPLCGGAYGNCPVDGPYPGGELTCPAGQYQPGASPPTLTDPSGGTWEPLQTLGGPTNTISDEAGRAMYGGWVIVPKNCTMNVTLSWYVPPQSAQPYSLLVQRQAGTFPELDLTILPDAGDCAQLGTSGLHYDSTLTHDTSFALPVSHASKTTAGQQSCYPQSGV